MVKTRGMGFEVHVVVVLPKSPNAHTMETLEDHFAAATHEVGSKIVTLTEHVSVSNEADAVEFVRGLVLEVVPPGSTITEIAATSD
jgi:hypothetical protein